MTCPFCNIITERTERIIHETEHAFVVLSNPRLMPGHMLVIPKKHVEKFSELSKEERADLFETAVLFQEKILEKLASGCDLSQHFRPFLKQDRLKVNHLHIHLRPRELEDTFYQKVLSHETEVFEDLSEEETEKYTRMFSEM